MPIFLVGGAESAVAGATDFFFRFFLMRDAPVSAELPVVVASVEEVLSGVDKIDVVLETSRASSADG